VVTNLTGGDDEVFGLALVGGGKLVAGGYAGANFAAVRYLSDGKLDHTFSGDGKAFVHFSQVTRSRIRWRSPRGERSCWAARSPWEGPTGWPWPG
jgi:hypothetical protein